MVEGSPSPRAAVQLPYRTNDTLLHIPDRIPFALLLVTETTRIQISPILLYSGRLNPSYSWFYFDP